jgi:tight adherence protein B
MLGTYFFLFFLCLNYAIYLLMTRRSEARSERLSKRVAAAMRDASSESDGADVQLLRRDNVSDIPLLNRLLGPLNVTEKLRRLIMQSDVNITVGGLLLFSLFAGVLAMFAAYTLLASLIPVVIVGAVAAYLPIGHVKWSRRRRINKFLEHLPDALELMGRSLAVGHAFSESLHQVSLEMPDPIATEFQVTYEEQKLGLSLKLAFAHLLERVPSLDLRLCVTAVLIQRETGGNLAEILEKVSYTMRERFKLQEEFRTLTTASRGSAWILTILPVAVVFIMYSMAPEYMGVLFIDKRGHYIIGTAVVMMTLGIFTIRRIMAIKF